MYIHMYIYIYVYTHVTIHLSLSLYIYIYIHIYTYVRVCVGASRRDDPPRLGRALLGHAGMLYMFTVGLGLGRQRI